MRSVWAIVACLGIALTVAACNPNEREYFRQGIGTELYTADTAAATEFLNVYLDYLCRQSESRIGPNVPSCADHVVPSNVWPLIVQAGLNDIDARCDSYLAWLDQKRRENAAILTEISAVRFAVDALTNPNVTGVSAVGLAAVSAAFGLATNTVGNFNSLLLQVDHTTVQTVVVGNRQVFREDLLKVSSSIDNKPFAVHTLRTYLSICMPMTISANINSTVTVFKQTGTAPGAGPVLPTLTPFRARDPAPTTPPDRGGLKVPHPEFAVWFKDYVPAQFPISTITLLQNVMCVPKEEVGQPPGVQSTTSSHIAIFEETSTERVADAKKITADGKIDTKERDLLIGEAPCNKSAAQNYFERRLTKNGTLTDVSAIIKLLNTEKLPGLNDLPLTTSLNDARDRIALVRQSLAGKQANAGKLKDRPFSMARQWTRDIADVLQGL
ncbi:hypothetical protein [Bradyrhizobium sp. WSM1417]|uniref:hypothetical protein n=1 Tax=Bradyrhizobium sp. WSM1417 TaxID=754500 RepID=UPI0004B39485|nr:hypothetical protein [Bradyrhizobium sp. WSM1417]